MESFSGYRQWLIVNEHQTSSRAATLVSDIRHIEEALPKTGYCGNGYTFKERPDVLRSIFKELDSIGKLDKRSQAPILSRIKNMLADVYRISVTNAKNHPPFNQLSTSRVNALKTALRLYFKFLSDFFGFFTVDQLYASRKIKVSRKTANRIEPNTKYKAEDYKRGIVGLMEKAGAIFSKGDKITLSMDNFRFLLEAYLQLHGGSSSNVLHETSFMTATCHVSPWYDWRVRFADAMRIHVNGDRIGLPEDCEFEFSPAQGAIISWYMGCPTYIRLPRLSVRPTSQAKLAMITACQMRIDERCSMLDEIRKAVADLDHQLVWFKDFETLNHEDLCVLFHERSKEMESVIQCADSILSLISKYASSFIAELVVE